LYRGTKREGLASVLLEFVLTLLRQSLLAFRARTPNGPGQTSICHAPILKTTYAPEFLPYHDDSDVNPSKDTGGLVSREEWTKPVCNAVGPNFKMFPGQDLFAFVSFGRAHLPWQHFQ
jgi:hypothetical protein